MILIPILEKLDAIMSGITELINKLNANEAELIKLSVDMVKELEDMSQNYRLPIQSQLAIIRGKLMCGPSKPNETMSRKDSKALHKRHILSQLDELNRCVQEYLADSRKAFYECERLACQVIVRLIAKGVLDEYTATNLNGEKLMELAARDSELAPIVVHITGLIGALNTKVIFDKTMSLAGL
ncbi:MAG: hypothetical protein IJ571_10730 [Ruminococcus sp.]|nr:hypothetical protein [Ruminococcus sp.]